MKSNYLIIYFLLFSIFGFSQEYDISGTVKEAGSGLPIPGVSVQEITSKKTSISDLDGKFYLSGIKAGATVTFSYIGFKNVDYKVNGDNNSLAIVLKEDAKSLEEVVVIGYGTQKKREVTGSVAVLDNKTIALLKPIKIEQALQGTVSGVNVIASSGAPGAGLNIRIRGVGTNGENGPTTIIDGYVGELGLLNPDDIESITVLKDAQAAIYGTIAANGIILVTTKIGKKNSKAKISYNTYTGFQETTRILPTLNATEYALLLNESYANGGQTLPFPNATGLGKGTNWQKKVFSRNVPIINHDIAVTGGSDKLTYNISGSHLDQEGIVGQKKSDFLRNTARLALNADLSDKLKIKTNVIYTFFNRRTLNEGGLGSVLFNALNAPPTQNVYDPLGVLTQVPSTTGIGNEIINPIAQIDNTYNSYNFKKLNGNFGFEYKIVKNLSVLSSIGFNTANSKSKSFSKQISYGGKVFDNPRSFVNQNAINDNDYSFDLFLNYNKNFNENQNVTLTLGNTIFKTWGNGLFATGFDVPNNSWEFADINLTKGLSTVLNNGSYNYDERRLSYFARFQYDYNSKYLFSAMLRQDASSRFGPEYSVAYFYSMTAGWIISDENFFKKSSFLSFMKLRGSYGTLGNDQIGSNRYLGLLTGEATYVFDGVLVNGESNGVIPNPFVKWEQQRKLDFGLDLKLMNDKIAITTDYFYDVRKDLLIPGIPVSGINGPSAPGSGFPTINAGDVRNSGVEFSIDYDDKITENLTFKLGYNVSFLDNKVTRINGAEFLAGGNFGVGQQPISRMQAGHALGYFYGFKTDGIFQNQAEVEAHPSQLALGANAQPGDIRYVDTNGDGTINNLDKRDLGNPIPKATMGFNFQMNYKNIDFAVYTFASLGNEIVRNYERVLSDANRLNYVLNRWTGEGTSNSVPRVTTDATSNNVFSDYFVEDGSFLRIQNIQVGYTLKSKLIAKAGVSKLRFYTSVNNLYTFTKYKGFDPTSLDASPIGGGIDSGTYPSPRTFMLGLNLNF